MKRNSYTPIIFVIGILFVSCSKDKDDVDLTDRASALLGQWKYESIMADHAVDLNADGTSNIDLFNTQEIKQCNKDDLTFFNQDGPSGKDEYIMTENALSCEDSDPFSILEEDFYQLVNDNNTISFEKRDEMRIIELTKKKLVVETDDVINDQNIVITITYKKG